MLKKEFVEKCNSFGDNQNPFLFVADFELNQFHLLEYENIPGANVFFNTPLGALEPQSFNADPDKKLRFELIPVNYQYYLQSFEFVKNQIVQGNSFLLNLTFPTKVETNFSLMDFYASAKAKYKLYFQDQFVLFSPETFIRIKGDKICSYPMKGTIDASIKNADQLLLSNEKEIWEHNTIVDLIRNDLSIVAKNVWVKRFRYLDRIKTHKNELLQMSSEIEGQLMQNWRSNLGDIITQLLPAGSVSGAPKRKTLEIIARAEGEPRGYFTGVFGIFNGYELDSAVMIRYIEKTKEGLQFRSGGGITGHSCPESEYREMINKVYVPLI